MSSFRVVSGRRGVELDDQGLRRNNTIGHSTQRRRNVTDASLRGPPEYDMSHPQPVSGAESPLYNYMEQSTLQRHASAPSRAKARGHSAMSPVPRETMYESSDIFEDDSYYSTNNDAADPSAQWAALRGSSHQRSVSEAEGSRSGSGSSPTSPRTDSGAFASGAFASSALSGAAGVRRHQSLNLHQHRQRQTSNFGPIGSPGRGAHYTSSGSRPRVSSVGEEDHAEPAFTSRTPWSPTPEEAVQLNSRHDHSGSSDGSHTSLPSPIGTGFNLERKLADLQVETAVSSSPSVSDGVWAVSPSLQPPQPPSRRTTPQLPPLNTSLGGATPGAPASASAAVPWVGRNHASAPREATHLSPVMQSNKHLTATPGAAADVWIREKDRLTGQQNARTAMHHPGVAQMAPAMPAYFSAEQAQTAALLQQQSYQIQQLQAQVAAGAASQWGVPPPLSNGNGVWPLAAATPRQPQHHHLQTAAASANGNQPSPIDIHAFAQSKGFNPPPHLVDLHPVHARYFVIKSYTEEDVHKSIKYSIWTSTALGNKRLDKAFRENAELGKIFLFFSVNSSGHFCGVAEMLTPVDETMDATVWAQSKWKGVLKVRWIYIRDVPNAALRHIRLSNTPEAKPVTSSRDTQEVPYEAGLEVLSIFSSHPSKTSLLQDYSFYESLELQRSLQSALEANNSGGNHDAHSNALQPTQQPTFVPAVAPRRTIHV